VSLPVVGNISYTISEKSVPRWSVLIIKNKKAFKLKAK